MFRFGLLALTVAALAWTGDGSAQDKKKPAPKNDEKDVFDK